MFMTIGQMFRKTKETGEPCAVKVASTVRRGAGRKGRKDLARSLPYPNCLPRLMAWRWTNRLQRG